jgi:hypothetical protein
MESFLTKGLEEKESRMVARFLIEPRESDLLETNF